VIPKKKPVKKAIAKEPSESSEWTNDKRSKKKKGINKKKKKLGRPKKEAKVKNERIVIKLF
jgi:hypothetical protein